LATPLKTCSLLVEQHGDALHLLFRHLPDPLDSSSIQIFAQSKIDLSSRHNDNTQLSLEYFVENVVDSSRYFVLRILDDRSKREARIGFGFRDRDSATDFREALQYYVKSLQRQEEAAAAALHFQEEQQHMNLSLQQGEKIRLQLPGSSHEKTISSKSTISKTPPSDSKRTGGPFLLKKPPPAPKLDKDISISFGDIDLNNLPGKFREDQSSTAAVGEASSAGEDDIWQDFEEAQD
jgi:adaptin ear-binding coat-associated protein 1/2